MKLRTLAATLFSISFLAAGAHAQSSPPGFSKTFSPDVIGPGSTTMLTFTIDNSDSASAVSDLDFTDILPSVPGQLTIADDAATFTCPAGTLTAPKDGTTISFTGGQLGAFNTCTISVKVRAASAAGTYSNVSGDLTSDAGNSGTASDDLTVDAALPGFSASFDDPNPNLGKIVTLTYLIDNSANASNVPNLDFPATLPAGFSFASPNNATTDCGTAIIPPTLTVAGTTITLDADGTSGFPAVAAGATCEVSVDIAASVLGTSVFTSGDLLAEFVSAGSASATLNVSAAQLNLAKTFIGDPVGAGSEVALEFELDNFTRDFAATGVAFTDDLTSTGIATLTFSSLLSNDCGGSVGGVGTTSVNFTGGTIAPEGSCTIRVSVTVPPGTTPGSYTNTTGAISGTVDGSPVTGNVATDTLQTLAGSPLTLAKEFVGGVVDAGNPVTLRFTIGNPNMGISLGATDITFLDELTDPSGGIGGAPAGGGFLPFPVSVTLPPVPDPPCGAGSSLALVSVDTDRQALELTGGELLSTEASCTFEVTVDIPADLPGGTYTNTTGPLSATISGATVVTAGASANLLVNGGLEVELAKSFDGVVAPGGTVDLTFLITNASDDVTADNITFTDDLAAMLTGTTASAPTTNTCDGTFTGSSLLSYSGGSLLPGADCTITVPVTVPVGAVPGTYPNETSLLTAAIGTSTPVAFPKATADLDVAGLVFTKEFLSNPVIAGDTTTLRFSIENQSPTDDATITFFTDDLAAALTGLAATGPASFDDCGGSLSGTTFLTYIGGSVLSGETCTIEVEVLVPGGAADDTYTNVTSSLSANMGGPVTVAPAVADLTVQSGLISLSKSFIDGPTSPGGTVTMRLELENLNALEAASAIAFTDDLNTMVAGTVPTGLPFAACGGTVSDLGGGVVDFSGGSLAAGAICSFDVTLSIPGTATGGQVTNTTSDVSATIGGFPVSGDAVSASVDISVVGTQFSASFNPDTRFPGESTDLTFRITNPNASTVTGLGFIADLNNTVSGLLLTAAPPNPCGAGSSIAGTGTSTLTFTGGEVPGLNGFCEFTVTLLVPTSAPGGTSSLVTSDLQASGAFSASLQPGADLTVVPQADISVTKDDGVTTATPGGDVTYTIVAANAGPSTAPSVTLTDTFPGDLTCAFTSAASGGATGNTAAGSGDLAETLAMPVGSSVTYTATCAIDSGATGTLSNTATVSSTIDDPVSGNDVATDGDTVLTPSADVSVTKSDGVTSVVAGQSLTYTIVAANAGPSDDPAVSIADAFSTDLACAYTSVAAGGATGNTAAGSGDIADTVAMPSGSSVTYTATCTVDEAATGTLSNTATAAASVTDPAPGNNSATDGDTVITPEADLSITKDDGLTSIDAGLPLTYTIMVSNAGPSTDPAASIADTFPAEMSGCTYTATATGGATGFTASGSGDINDTAVSMPSGSSVTYLAVCTVDPATPTTTLSNTATVTASVTDPAPGNNSATDGNTSVSPTDLMFSKLFAPDSVEQGQSTELTFTINNDVNAIAATGLTFSDDLTAFGLVLTSTPPVNDCAGSLTADEDTSVVSFSGGTVAAGSTCEITVTLRADLAGTHDNVTTQLTSNLPTQPGATDTLAVSPAQAPTLSKTLSSTAVEEGEVISMTLELANPNGFLDATSVDLQDVMTGNLAVTNADAAGTPGCDGTVTGAVGDETVSFAGTVAANMTCTITVDLIVLAAADFTNTATVTTSLGDTSDSVDVTVTAAVTPTLTKVLSSTAVQEGEAISMTLEITNPNSFRAAESVVLTDDMTGTLQVSSAATGSAGCDGTVAGAIGGEAVSFNGTVDPGATCTVTVGLIVIADADFTNTANMTSSLGDASAEVPVSVTPAPPLTFSMTFVPDTVEVIQRSTLTYTIQNTSLVKATAISIADTLPANLIIARPATRSKTCVGGMVGAVEGGSDISYDGGELDPLSTCTVSVDVVSAVADTYPNSTEAQTSSLGDSATASATLTVEPASNGNVIIVQRTDADGDGNYVFSSAEPSLNFTIAVTGGTGSAGPFALPAGSYSISQTPPEGVGNTAISCDDTDSTGDPIARTISVNLSGLETVTCTITSITTLQKTVDTINRFLTKRADLILSSEPRPGRRFDRLNRGFGNASRFSWAPGDLKAFLPFSAQVSGGSGEYRFSTSMLQVRQAAASLALAHGSTKDVAYVDNYRFDAWFEAQFKKFDTGAQGEGHFAIAYFGADYLLTPDILVGVMAQIDDMQDLSAALNTSARGTGWMLGPYMTARLAPNLYFDGRLAAGRSSNEVSPFNTYVDEFSTDRWLAMASITGDFQRGPWNVKPAASLSYFEENQGSYIDGLGVAIPSQTVRLGQFKIGPTFSGKFETDDGTLLAPYFGIDAIFNLGETTGVTISNPATPATEGWRGRLQAGLDLTTENGTRISFGGTYDGLFRKGFESWGVMFDITIPLSKPIAR